MSSVENVYCTCSTLPEITTSIDVNQNIIEEFEITSGNFDEIYGFNEKIGYEYDCVPNIGCIPETCVDTVCIDECVPGGCVDACKGWLGSCKTCSPEICTGKVCSDDLIPSCIPKVCTDDLCLQASLKFECNLKLHFDYNISVITKEINPIGGGLPSVGYEQRITFSNVYFQGKLLYEEKLSDVSINPFSYNFKLKIKNPTTIYCREKVDPTTETFSCGGCTLLTNETIGFSVSDPLTGIKIDMDILDPTIGICEKASENISGIFCNATALVSTQIKIPECPTIKMNTYAVFAAELP